MQQRIAPVVSLVLCLFAFGPSLAACGAADPADPGPGGGDDQVDPTDDGGNADGTSPSPGSDGSASPDGSSSHRDGASADTSPPFTGDAGAATACTNPPCINVVNQCPFPLWIHAANSTDTLAPDNAQVAAAGNPGHVKQFNLPASWPAARVNAYWEDPNAVTSDENAFDKVELTFGSGTMNYNITYVDYLALPVKMEAISTDCPKTPTFDPAVSCALPVGSVLSGCPAGMLDGKRCLSGGLYCANATHAKTPFCHALDTAIQTCASQNPATCGIATQLGNTTPNAYGCSGYFDSQPANCSPASASCHQDGNKWCAALNRGMLSAPDSTDTSLYYKTAPFNAYAKWVHDTCPGIYAFPYDDYPSGAGAGGFRACKAERLDITFCPGG